MSVRRKFDWDEARRLRAQGYTYAAIATRLGVSTTAVIHACDPRQRLRARLITAAHQQSGTCIDCGKRCCRNDTLLRRGIHKGRCRECASKHAATTVRDDALKCVTCKQWLWDTAFPHDARMAHRRGRHRECTACNTKSKREWRRRKQAA